MGQVVLFGYPNPKQREFFLTDARHVGYGGARGGGKSWALRRKMVLRRLKYPGSSGLLLRRTYPELYENHVIPLRQELQGVARYNQERHEFIFPNGSRLVLGYCDSEADVFRYQGQEYDDIGLEEATRFTEFQRNFLVTCNRTTRTDLKPRMYYTANPGGPGHAWFKRLFIDRQFREGENPEDYVFIPARVYDNPHIMRNDPEYVRQLESLPEQLRRAYLEGDWDIFSGQVFTEFRRDVHVVAPFEVPKEWRKWRALDYGYANPACVLWLAVAPDDTVYVYRELYQAGLTAAQLAQKVVELSRGEDVILTLADPAIFAKTGHEGESIAETLRANGLPVQRADNDRLAGKQRVHEYLTVSEGPDGRPVSRLRIFSTCLNLIRTLPQLTCDPHRPEDVDTACEDHAYDALRYALMNRLAPKVERFKKRIVPHGISPITGY